MLLWALAGGILLVAVTKRNLFYVPNTHFSDFANVVVPIITRMGEASFIIPVLLLLLLVPALRTRYYLVQAACCNFIPFIIQQILKSTFDLPRPRLLFYDRLWMHYQPEWPVYLSRSFPSGHATGAFSFFCFLSLLLVPGRKAWGFLFFLAAMLVAYSRIYLATHFFEDVYAGSLIGTALTTFIFSYVQKRKDNRWMNGPLNLKLSTPAKYLLVAIGAAVLFMPNIGQVHLFDWDEINFAECAREMIVSKDYLRAQIDFMPFWEKPPFFIWMQVLSMKTFGISEFAARFPNAVAGVVTLVSLFHIGRKVCNERMAAWWVAIYTASWLPQFYFMSGIIDPTFNLFIFLAFYQLWRLRENAGNGMAVLLAGLFLGMAVITKGPVAVLVTGLAIAVYVVVNKGFNGYRPWQLLGIFLVALVPVALWLGSAVMMHGWAYGRWFVTEFLTYQVRLFRTEDSDHGGPFYYHFAVLLVGCFPASIFLFNYRFRKTDMPDGASRFSRWMWILFWVVLILFSIVKTKIVHYSSLCYFPLTWLAAQQVYRITTGEQRLKGLGRLLLLIVGVLLALLIAALPIAGIFKDSLAAITEDPFARGNLRADVYWSAGECAWGLAYLAGIIFAVARMRRKPVEGLVFLVILQMYIVQAAVVLFTPKIEAYSQRAAIDYYKGFRDKDVYIHALGYKSYANLFYAEKQPWHDPHYQGIRYNKADHDYQPEANEQWLLYGKLDKPAYFICKLQDSAKFAGSPQLVVTGSKNGFVFFSRR